MMSLEKKKARFWANVIKTDTCWIWAARKNNWGYGKCGHSCDNPACCNPQHLYAGTLRQNSADMRNRGRARFAKLSIDAVASIKRRLAAGESKKSIATEYSVIEQTITRIARGITWA